MNGNNKCRSVNFFTFTGSELLILYLIFSILTGMALSKLDSPFIGIADFTDSILTGIPLQTIFLKENSREMEVIDGVQRIKTILGFLNDEFPVLSENEKWNGCTYSQLKSIDQRKIEDFQVPAYILHDDESGEMAIRIFQNLNIRMTAFTSQEIRNYLYADQGMPYVEKLSKNNYFQKTIQNKEIDFATHQ